MNVRGAKQVSSLTKPDYTAESNRQMELLVLLLIGLLILIVVLPFVAMSKASAAKRSVDDLFTRLLTVENDVRTLRRQNSSSATRPQAQSSETAARTETSPPPPPAISVQPTPEQAQPST